MRKKLMTTLAILACASTASAATYELGDLTYTIQTANPGGGGDHFSSASYFDFTLSNDLFNNTSSNSVWATASDGSTSYLDTPVALTSVTLTQHGNQNTAKVPDMLILKDSDNNVISTATDWTRINDVTLSNGLLRDQYTWTFEGLDSLLVVGETYTIAFATTGGVSDTWDMDSTPLNGQSFAHLNGNAQHQPGAMTMTFASTNVVPEPATASLSLLGLAALMMRRRRA